MNEEKQLTGRKLVLFRDQKRSGERSQLRSLEAVSRTAVPSSTDFKLEEDWSIDALLEDAPALLLEDLGVAIVANDQEEMANQLSEDPNVLLVEDEGICRTMDYEEHPDTLDEIGFGGGDPDRAHRPSRGERAQKLEVRSLQSHYVDDATGTWGIHAMNVDLTDLTGRGIRVAVLDTGCDNTHPDFNGRFMLGQSFIKGTTAFDGNGHGTHCVGSACGPGLLQHVRRYGVATEAQIYVGKVLNDRGSGPDGAILAGMEWAIRNRCEVISMSLGREVSGGNYSRTFEEVAHRALRRGSLIIAAAGNGSRRPQHVRSVAHPANCPSVMAVAAVDQFLKIADFSNEGRYENGGEINLSGAGVKIFSAWPVKLSRSGYNVISGTSMATPHVAGLAALLAQSDSRLRGRELAYALLAATAPIPGYTLSDVGHGFGLVDALA